MLTAERDEQESLDTLSSKPITVYHAHGVDFTIDHPPLESLEGNTG